MSKRQRPPAFVRQARPPATAASAAGALALPKLMEHAMAAYRRCEWTEAERLCRAVLNAKADHFDALHLCGIIAAQNDRAQEASELLTKAVSVNPRSADVRNSLGNVLRDLERHADALVRFDEAIALRPDFASAYNNRGNALHELEKLGDALASYDRAVALKPDYAGAWFNRSNVLRDLRRDEEALESLDRAISLNPYYAEAHVSRGDTLNTLLRYTEALECYQRALAIEPESADAYYGRGNVLCLMKRHDEAVEAYERALRIDPDLEFLDGTCLITRLTVCDWQDFAGRRAALTRRIERGERAGAPFVTLAVSGDPALQRKAAEIWVQAKHPARHALPPIARRPRRERIRVGYFSADLHEHAVSFLMAELFERHDRTKFEITAFSLGPDSNGAMRQRLRAAFERFIDVRRLPDIDVALLARELEIDIAIDLGGFTTGSRTGIFANRAAPVQAGYLGYLGTMGAEYMDYLLADAVIIPPESRGFYTERIAYLPSYQANDTRRFAADRTFTREELGLPQTGFVYCCFNNGYKINPDVFDSWMRILMQVEGSVLFLLAENDTARANLRKEAERRGVHAGRLIFGERLPMPDYLARYRAADLFLDTLPYNAGTTASDALWAGLPVLTCTGATFASRMAASLLTAIRLPELVTSSREDYERLAVALAADPDRLGGLRRRLDENRLTTPLFDIGRFTGHVEAAYAMMHERSLADLPPEDLRVHAGELW